MTIRSQLRNYRILVNDLDVSACVRAEGSGFCEAGEDLIDVGAWFRTTGSLVLMPVRGFTESLDPRRNTRWIRGAQVKIQLAQLGSNSYLPYRTLRVLQDPLPPRADQPWITLSLGDLLSLLDFEQPDGIENEFEVGETKDRTDLINQLLGSIGGPTLIDTISEYPLEYPVYRDNSSVVKQCARIAYEAGYALWVDPNEAIRAIPLDPGQHSLSFTFAVATDLSYYAPIEARQQPTELLKVFGVAYPVDDNAITVTTTETEQGFLSFWDNGNFVQEYGIRRRTTRTDTVDWTARTRVVEELIEEPVGLLLMFFLRGDLAARTLLTSKRSTTESTYDEHGYLVERFTQVSELITQIGKGQAWANLEYQAEVEAGLDGERVSLEQTEKWVIDSKQRLTSYSLFKRESHWKVLGDYDLALYGDDFNETRLTLRDAELTTQSWTERDRGEWQFRQFTNLPYIAVLRSQADSFLEISELPPLGQRGQLVADSSQSVDRISADGDTRPPAAERIPSPKDLAEIPLEVELAFDPPANAQFRKRKEQLEIETCVSEEQLTQIGTIYGKWVAGQQFAIEAHTALPSGLLATPTPLIRVQIAEPDGFTYQALAQGHSLVLAEDSALWHFQTVYLGEVVGSTIVPPYTNGPIAEMVLVLDFEAEFAPTRYRRLETGGRRLLESGVVRIREG